MPNKITEWLTVSVFNLTKSSEGEDIPWKMILLIVVIAAAAGVVIYFVLKDRKKEPVISGYCPNCGHPYYEQSDRFCHFCGADLHPAPAVPEKPKVQKEDTGTEIFLKQAGGQETAPADKTDILTPEPHTMLTLEININGIKSTVEISSFPCVAGRMDGESDLLVSEPAVSGKHVRFLFEDGRFYAEDISEHNGTYLNQLKMPKNSRQEIKPGDVIKIGRALLTVKEAVA